MYFGLKPKKNVQAGREIQCEHNGEEDEREGPLYWGFRSVSKSGWFCNISYFESLSSSQENNCMPLSETIKHSKGFCGYMHSLPFSYLCPLSKQFRLSEGVHSECISEIRNVLYAFILAYNAEDGCYDKIKMKFQEQNVIGMVLIPEMNSLRQGNESQNVQGQEPRMWSLNVWKGLLTVPAERKNSHKL